MTSNEAESGTHEYIVDIGAGRLRYCRRPLQSAHYHGSDALLEYASKIRSRPTSNYPYAGGTHLLLGSKARATQLSPGLRSLKTIGVYAPYHGHSKGDVSTGINEAD